MTDVTPSELRAIEDLPDDAVLWAFVSKRPLSALEQDQLITLTDRFLARWSGSSGCTASRSEVTQGGQVLVWAVDFTKCRDRGYVHGMTGSDLEPYFRQLERLQFDSEALVSPEATQALIVGGLLILDMREWVLLARAGLVSADTLVLHGCTVGEWRSGHFVHRLAEDPGWYDLIQRQAEKPVSME